MHLGGHNVHSNEVAQDDMHDTHSTNTSSTTSDTPLQRLQLALEALKFQHSALTQALGTHSYADQGFPLRASPLLATAREEEETRTPSTGFSTVGRASHRLSSQSDGSIWYDAEEYDGAEEFVLDDGLDDVQVKTEALSVVTPTSSSTSTGLADLESSSESSDEESVAYEESPESLGASTTIPAKETAAVVRRTQLPSPPVGDEGSLFAVLKKNVGKAGVNRSSYCAMSSPVAGPGFRGPPRLIQRATHLATKTGGGARVL